MDTCDDWKDVVPDSILDCEGLTIDNPFQVGHDTLVVQDRSSTGKGCCPWCVYLEGIFTAKGIQGSIKCHVIFCGVDLQKQESAGELSRMMSCEHMGQARGQLVMRGA